jgi:CRP/FNR family transcriptional regulator, cyclic AMP receptor protein
MDRCLVKPETLTFAPKQIIFNEGDETNGIFHVQEGQIEIFRIRENTEVILGTLKPGDVLGTITLFSKEPRTATARAVTQTVAIFYQSEGLGEAFKTLPGWSQALIKDAIGRLKHVNDLLISTKLNEKNLLKNIGTSHHHCAQLAYLLASFVRKASIMNESKIQIFPTKDFIVQAECILMKKFSYLESIFNAFIDCGLIKEIDDKKYGKILLKPNAALIEEYAIFCLNVVKKGTNFFIPKKYHPWMSALARISRKNNNIEKFKREEIALLLQTDLGRQDGEVIISNLIQNEIIEEKEGCILFSSSKLQKTVVFESLSRIIKDIKP